MQGSAFGRATAPREGVTYTVIVVVPPRVVVVVVVVVVPYSVAVVVIVEPHGHTFAGRPRGDSSRGCTSPACIHSIRRGRE
jgi:hypothetical protein